MLCWRASWPRARAGRAGAAGGARPSPRRCRRCPASLALAGIGEPVRVVRDRWGVPHIYARNEHDLFFAQGFVQAQDRLFQMDLWRRSVQGRLSEVLGLELRRARRDDPPDAVPRRRRGRLGELRARRQGDRRGVRRAASTRGWPKRACTCRRSSPWRAGCRSTWSAEDLLNRTDAFVAAGADADVFRARLVAALGEQRAGLWFGRRRAVSASGRPGDRRGAARSSARRSGAPGRRRSFSASRRP